MSPYVSILPIHLPKLFFLIKENKVSFLARGLRDVACRKRFSKSCFLICKIEAKPMTTLAFRSPNSIVMNAWCKMGSWFRTSTGFF